MSSIASLFNVPGTEEEIATWSFAHSAHHRDVNRLIYEQSQIALPEFMFDPFQVNDTGQWADQHQQIHNLVNQILGTAGFNIDDWDWNDRGVLNGVIFLNASEHRNWSDILGLG